ncbi:MAG: HlyD family secretion protein [Cyclobacteriaceae bacterium]
MLNISNYKVDEAIKNQGPSSFSKVTNPKGAKMLTYWMIGVALFFIIILFLPWTQNVRSEGYVTTLKPEQRPQSIHSIIAGRIEKWHVREGQLVTEGDTIVSISEIKPSYLDPKLLDRIKSQIEAKQKGIVAYESKIVALDNQINAIRQSMQLKLKQAQNKYAQSKLKLASDSAKYNSAKTDFNIANKQYERIYGLYEKGIKSLTAVEEKRAKLQSGNAKIVSAENNILISQNNLINAKLQLSSLKAEYLDKESKAFSDKFSAETMLFEGTSQLLKMKNQLTNYEIRNGYYHVVAPQDCYITRAIVPGIGELIKEGNPIVSIMPADYQLAVELYINPVDYALIHKGEHVRLLFDGWPAVVFSGWPNTSVGSYGGKIVAIDQNISSNTKYRILIGHEAGQRDWPDALRVGSGAVGMALLNDVPLWYELWRNLSGFPPEYYTGINEDEEYKKSDY